MYPTMKSCKGFKINNCRVKGHQVSPYPKLKQLSTTESASITRQHQGERPAPTQLMLIHPENEIESLQPSVMTITLSSLTRTEQFPVCSGKKKQKTPNKISIFLFNGEFPHILRSIIRTTGITYAFLRWAVCRMVLFINRAKQIKVKLFHKKPSSLPPQATETTPKQEQACPLIQWYPSAKATAGGTRPQCLLNTNTKLIF